MLWSLVTQHSPPRLPARLPTTGLPSHRSGRGMSSNLPFPLPPPPPAPKAGNHAARRPPCSWSAAPPQCAAATPSRPPDALARSLARPSLNPAIRGNAPQQSAHGGAPVSQVGGTSSVIEGGKGHQSTSNGAPSVRWEGGQQKEGGKGWSPRQQTANRGGSSPTSHSQPSDRADPACCAHQHAEPAPPSERADPACYAHQHRGAHARVVVDHLLAVNHPQDGV